MKSTFDGDNLRFEFHLAPPLFARRDKPTGEPKKMTFGPWMLGVLRVLTKLKVLRGTPFDPFGYTDERRTERQLIADYEELLTEMIGKLTPDNHRLAVGLAAHPGKNPRLRPGQAAAHLAAAKAEEAALTRAIPRRCRAVSQGGGII